MLLDVPTETSNSSVPQILAKVLITSGSDLISQQNCSCPAPFLWKRPPLSISIALIYDKEMDSLGKRRKVLRSPSRSIFGVESFSERFEPFVHPIDILIALLLGDDVLDDSVLTISDC
jgi:hypothetical protein